MKKIICVLLFILLINCSSYSYADEEKPQLTFDGRVWSIGYQASNFQGSIIEYILSGESIENWTELVTIQTFLGLQKNTSAQAFAEKTKENLKAQCQDLRWNILKQTEDDVIYEWSIKNCPIDKDQHEIARIVSGKYGIYVFHYVTKKIPINAKIRSEWIKLIKSATINQSSSENKEKIENNTLPVSEELFYSTS
jgi:hypothetical protein